MTPPVLNNDKRLFKLGGVIHFGGPEGDRTLDLTDANRTLSQTELRAHIGHFSIEKVMKNGFSGYSILRENHGKPD